MMRQSRSYCGQPYRSRVRREEGGREGGRCELCVISCVVIDYVVIDLSLVHNMLRSNATRCDWLRARCFAPRQRRGGQFTILERVALHLAATPPFFITWFSFISSVLYYIHADIRSQQLKLDRILPITFVVQYIGQVNWQYTHNLTYSTTVGIHYYSGFECHHYIIVKYIYIYINFGGK